MTKIRRLVGVSLFLVSCLLMIWGLWPAAVETREVAIAPEEMQMPAIGQQANENPPADTQPMPAVVEQRRLRLEWPSKIKVGDAEAVRLTLEMDESGSLVTPRASSGTGMMVEQVNIPNVYETHNVIAEARLDITGLEFLPSGQISTGMKPGQAVVFIWSVRPDDIGDFEGAVWLHLLFTPKDGGPEFRTVISAQVIDIQAVDFVGLGGSAARILGSVGIVIGSVLGLDAIAGFFLDRLTRRFHPERSTNS